MPSVLFGCQLSKKYKLIQKTGNRRRQHLLGLYLKVHVLHREVSDALFLLQDLLSQYSDRESDRYKFPKTVDFLLADNNL